ncbi:hypothetical protein CPB83DRAFT_778474 [Crepidotus variabilis]|uniref:Uncharacterized protein n=1 Tax=Crepidotus variabilis TaxID=179855 RepID=A0A9P6JHP2_9AGAR|nr:hypothetical protein CPB83DRAFT_778474 [Crepidotus variabilis]
MTLPKNIPTLEASNTKNLTRVDNIFARLRPNCTNHFPVMTVIEAGIGSSKESKRRNFRATDWQEFGKVLKRRLEDLPKPKEFVRGEEAAADKARKKLERAVLDTIGDCVPVTKPVPFEKRWWNKMLRCMQQHMFRLGCKANLQTTALNDPIHKAYC